LVERNYSPPEIETLAEEIDGVDGSYTAACAVRRPGGADQLAIFFCVSNGCAVTATALIDKIREQIVRNAGIKPDYIIPLKQEDIPRTSIGKIQYAELRERFEKGEYDALLKQIDIETANANTIPDWFFQRVWLRRESTIEGDMGAAPTSPLVFGDAGGFAAKIFDRSIVVEAGSEFRRISADRYRIDPREAEHYTRLLQSLVSDGVEVRDVIHLVDLPGLCGTYTQSRGDEPRSGSRRLQPALSHPGSLPSAT
jgi:hypothetical protein